MRDWDKESCNMAGYKPLAVEHYFKIFHVNISCDYEKSRKRCAIIIFIVSIFTDLYVYEHAGKICYDICIFNKYGVCA
ncbi:hypothetical protein GCM10023261_03220 [Bartonella jaculi]|uniref:Uncharacterized protein n=1 Tax=Bartonella jaculi TaxID=686226 RepID=A0ABP9N221_9HYPH